MLVSMGGRAEGLASADPYLPSNNGARAAKRKSVHPKHGSHPSSNSLQSPAPALPPVMEMMGTILEFEEKEENCSTPGNNQSHHLNLTNPLANTSYEFQSPDASILLHHLQSPADAFIMFRRREVGDELGRLLREKKM